MSQDIVGTKMANGYKIHQWDKIRPVGQKLSTGTKIKLWDKIRPQLRNVGRFTSCGNKILIILDSKLLEIYRERYSRWNYYILEKVYIILLCELKKY